MELKTLLKLRVPRQKLADVVLLFPLHQGDRRMETEDCGKYYQVTYYINHWHYHRDQIEFCLNYRIIIQPEIAAAPSVALERYVAYAATG